MGCKTSKNKSAIHFVHGHPTFQGDEVVKAFDRGNGLLFRISNKKKAQWAYYNDTKKYEFHVTVTFNPECDIKALGNTKLERLESGEYVASVVVPPRKTEMFIEGKVNGFKSKMDAFEVENHSHS